MDPTQTLAQIGITAGPAADPAPQGVALAETSGVVRPRVTAKSLTYDQIVDILLLASPGETHRSIAQRIGYSESWLSRMIASDAFQVRLHTRIEKDIEPERQAAFKARFAGIEEEARGVLLMSLKKLSDKLADPAVTEPELMIKSATMAAKMLGYGARSEPPQPKMEMHFHLQQLAQNVRNLNSAPVTIDQSPSGPPLAADSQHRD